MLVLNNNPIEAVQSLSAMVNLRSLRLLGNPLRDRTYPLQPTEICQIEADQYE